MNVEQLLEAARAGAEPSAEERARVGWALRGAIAAGTLPSSSWPDEGGLLRVVLRRGTWANTATVLSVGVLVGFGLGRVSLPTETPSATSRSSHVVEVARADRAEPPGPPVSAVEEATPEGPRETEPRTETKLRREGPLDDGSAASDPRPKEPSHDPEAFRRVLGLVQRAQTALRGGDSRGALEILNGADASEPPEILAEERGALRARAACQSAPGAGARDYARVFLARYPSSMYAKRILETCGLE